MSKQLREHQARKTALVKEARALTDLVASQDRDMTDDEVSAFEALRARIDAASTAIDREAALIADESLIGLATIAGPSVSDNGVPVGALSAGATITVAKESGQATQTLVPQNLAKMISRLPAGSFANSVWIVNNDVLPALFTLTLGNYPIYIPTGLTVGGMQVSPYGTLLGRPVFVSQHANTFSAQGDILLVDLKYYLTITKAGGMQTATSMHLYFDADLTAFRTTFRMDGQSKITTPIAPAKGSTTMSPFIQLGAR